jgi:hypothetical protein
MSDSKIHIKVGIVEFSGEGESKWLSEQLDKIIDKIPELLKIELSAPINNNGATKPSSGNHNIEKPDNIANWLKDKNATSNQTRKFLAAAAYLQLNGKERMNTGDISGILKQYNQGKLGNASDALAKNVSKGHCDKDGKSFYVRPEGFKELGIEV